MNCIKIFKMAWFVGVPLIRKKYPLETELVLTAYKDLKKLRKTRG